MNENIIQAVETAYQHADTKRWESIQELVFSGYVDAIVEFFNTPIIETNALSSITAYEAGGKIAHKAIDYLGMTFAVVIDTDHRYSSSDQFDDSLFEIDIDQFQFYADGQLVFATTISSSMFQSLDGERHSGLDISLNIDNYYVARPGSWGNILVEALAHMEVAREVNDQNAQLLHKAHYLRIIDKNFSALFEMRGRRKPPFPDIERIII